MTYTKNIIKIANLFAEKYSQENIQSNKLDLSQYPVLNDIINQLTNPGEFGIKVDFNAAHNLGSQLAFCKDLRQCHELLLNTYKIVQTCKENENLIKLIKTCQNQIENALRLKKS